MCEHDKDALLGQSVSFNYAESSNSDEENTIFF